jgi:hypothetical protein
MDYIPYVLLAIVVIFFGRVLFSSKKYKEYAVYMADGKVYHLYRREQDKWFEGFGQMVFYRKSEKDPNKYLRINIGNHWYTVIKELENSEWAEIEKQKNEGDK